MAAKTVLVVGGAGFIGSYVNKMLAEAGFDTVVFDNLSRGHSANVTHGTFVHGDLNHLDDLEAVFSNYPIDAVMHFAAFIDVGESVLDPLKYYINNVGGTLNLLRTMIHHGTPPLVFSSTAAIFGTPLNPLVDEKHPHNPINPYGEGKLFVETVLQDCDKAYGLKSCCLRYFNATGGDPDGIIKNRQTRPTNLIPIALRSLLTPSGSLTINGTDYPTPDGTCVRDYIHIHDLAMAHLLALRSLMDGSPSSCYNLGNGHGFSIREVIAAVQQVTGRPVHAVEGPRRPGDPPILVADAKKARLELGWNPHYPSLERMIEHAWQTMQ